MYGRPLGSWPETGFREVRQIGNDKSVVGIDFRNSWIASKPEVSKGFVPTSGSPTILEFMAISSFGGTNPTNESITSGLPVIQELPRLIHIIQLAAGQLRNYS
jgi:hypothetical protein